MTSIQRSPRRARAAVATVATAAVLALPVVAAVPAAADDGPNGEVTGYVWDQRGVNLWEGTYRMFDGTEAWCATVGAWEPGDNPYGDPQPLDLGDPQRNSELAYIVSEASSKVLGKTGQEAQDYAAATSIIIHDWTNSHNWEVNIPGLGDVRYSPIYPLAWFDATDREGVQEAYDALLADAALYAGEWELELGAVIDGEPAIGDEFLIEGVLSVDGRAIAGHDVELTVAGATVPSGTIVTNALGAFSVEATVTGTEVEIEASAVAPANQVSYRAPLDGWNTPDGSRPQDMITVEPTYLTEELDFTVAGIGTTATSSLPFDGGIVVDTVAYENLVPDATYTIEGELFDKADGLGTGITAQTTFQASTSGTGTVDIEFTVPHGHDGKT